MPAYRQNHSFYEAEYGTVTISFVIGDTYESLFGESFIMTNIFLLSESSKDLEESEGVQSEDEVRFKINEVLCETEDDFAARTFTLAATNPATKRFCAVFINTGSTPSIEDAEFTGVLRPDFKANDLKWHGEAFTTTPDPLRVWDISAQSFFTNMFDEVEVKDLIFGNEALMVEPISEGGWVTANVGNREGYARLYLNKITKYAQLVNLNKLLVRMAEKLTDSLEARGLGEYTINFVETELDFKLSPARTTSTGPSRYVYTYIDSTWRVKSGDAYTIKMGDTGVDSDIYSLHISYALFDPSVVVTPPGGDEKTYQITDNVKKFTDLLYAIAANIGCFVEFTYTDSVTLNIAFRPRRDIVKGAVYIRDVTKANLTAKPRSNKENAQYYADSFGLARDGWDMYACIHSKSDTFYPSASKKDKRTGNRLLLSISPTLRSLEWATDDGATWKANAFPHNVIMYDDGTATSRNDSHCGMESVDSQGITTALYLNVVRNGEYGFTTGDRLYAPAAMLTVKINGVNQKFDSIADYINSITVRDKISFDGEYNLTIPFLCGFRKSADGSHADDDGGRGSWKNCRNGNVITIDGIEYPIVGIKRALDKPETTLRIHNVSRFSFGEAEALAEDITPDMTGAYLTNSIITDDGTTIAENNTYGNYIPGEALYEGDFVSQLEDGKVYKSKAHHSHVLRLAGIATQTIDEDAEVIRVLEEGRYTSTRYTLLAGMPIFIRTSEDGDFNGSHDWLDNTNETEDTYISCARAVLSHTLVIRRGDEFVYNPCLEDE